MNSEVTLFIRFQDCWEYQMWYLIKNDTINIVINNDTIFYKCMLMNIIHELMNVIFIIDLSVT